MKKILITVMMFLLLLTINTSINASELDENLEQPEVSTELYPSDEVVEVNIEITEENYSSMLTNAVEEEYYTCNITYNGVTLTNVAIRTKGNSSLRDVYQNNGDRYSFNIDLNYYEDQDLFGIDKLILNNLFQDPSMMAEYISYEALVSLDATASRTAFASLSINGEYYGLYLSVEHVGNEFLDTNFGNSDNELYKPEMGNGADLDYISDSISDYTGLENKNADITDSTNILNLLAAIESGENLDSIFNVDGFLQYLAVSTYTIHLDSYQGSMFHNYYLYDNEGIFEWIAWDLNMSFNGFNHSGLSDEEAVLFLIDEPVVGSMENYPLIETILSNDEYLETYHSYLQELLDNYFEPETFEARVLEIEEMIDSYVESDTNSFYTYSEFQEAVDGTSSLTYSLVTFVENRTQNIQQQLDETIPSTNNGQGNEGQIMGDGMIPGQMFPRNNDTDMEMNPGDRMDPSDRMEPRDGFDPNQEPLSESTETTPTENTFLTSDIFVGVAAVVIAVSAIIILLFRKK